MSDALFTRWLAGCHNFAPYGATPGDSFWQGLQRYDAPFPCPNGLPPDTRSPHDCPSYVARIEKARRDIEEHRAHIDAMELKNERIDEFRAGVQAVLDNPQLIEILKKGFKAWVQIV